MSKLTKKAFRIQLSEFKASTVGAACFQDALGTSHCANGLTQDQAKTFAERHALQLLRWVAGSTCSDLNC
jgi:hypothetical protein